MKDTARKVHLLVLRKFPGFIDVKPDPDQEHVDRYHCGWMTRCGSLFWGREWKGTTEVAHVTCVKCLRYRRRKQERAADSFAVLVRLFFAERRD